MISCLNSSKIGNCRRESGKGLKPNFKRIVRPYFTTYSSLTLPPYLDTATSILLSGISQVNLYRKTAVFLQVKADSSNDFIQFTRVPSFIRQRVHAASTTAEGQTRKTKLYEKLEFKTRQLFRRFFQYFTWIFCCGDSLCERSLARCTEIRLELRWNLVKLWSNQIETWSK